jgi:isocitrate dehydrogenase
MSYQHLVIPPGGAKITVRDGRLVVPDNPILGFVRGDGIGPDIMRASLRVWDAAVSQAFGGRRRVHWMEIFMGEQAAALYGGDPFPPEAQAALKDVLVSIKGPLTTPVGGGIRSLNVALRQQLDLYACVRPVRYYAGVPSPLREPEQVDVVIFRENTEDVYAGIEFKSGTPENAKLAKFLREELGASFFEDAGLGVKPMSAFGSKRLVRKAIRYALEHGRESVTLVHKGNIMKYTEGAFRNWGYEVAREEFGDRTITEEELYSRHGGKRPEGRVVIKDRIADIMFQMMLLRPSEFDVIATPNLNGDYLSDAIAAEVGGVGIAPGANMADHLAVFEATHGTAPKYAGQDKVNPGSLLLSGVMMLEYIGWTEAATLIRHAYPRVVQKGLVTYDFARQMEGATEVSTSGFADALIAELRGLSDPVALRQARRRTIESLQHEREAQRVAEPEAAMEASGRVPTCVADIMTRLLITVSPRSTVEQAMHMMREHGVSSVLVEPEAAGPWGIMTQRDVVSRIVNANRSPAEVKVGDIATRPLIMVPGHTSLHDCSTRMLAANIRRVVVEQDGVPVGIVSDTDLFRVVDEHGWVHA